MLLLTGLPAGAEEGMSEIEQIGPYQLERAVEGLEIRTGSTLGLRGALAIVAGLCIVAAVVLAGLVATALPGAALGALGLALAVAAGMAPAGAERVQVSHAGLVVEGFVGQQGATSADAVASIEVRRRNPTGPETKRSSPPRRWQVTVRGRAGAESIVRFRLASREQARALAGRVGEVLDRPVVEREGVAR